MAGYNTLSTLLTEELDQLFEEGRAIDKEAFRTRIASAESKEQLMALYHELQALPMREDYPYCEPSLLAEIEAQSDASTLQKSHADTREDDFYGAWLGRCIGCAWGQPVEGWRSEDIVTWYKEAGKYPIRSYVPTVSGGRRNEGPATDEKICGMPLDDDTRFTVLYYLLVREKGTAFDSWDVGDHWSRKLPFRFVCTAENQAYLNFLNIDQCTPWCKPHGAAELLREAKVNTYLNPYREWIGAQIRCDAFAYLAAGDPLAASRMAHADAYFSHAGNGIYGEMFFAALIAAAFTEKDINVCFETALAVVPRKSRFYETAVWARDLAKSDLSRHALLDTLLTFSKTYNWVHTLNNAAFCIAAITRYSHDFRRAVAFAVECGLDTDCNGATVGSFMGAFLGKQGIPEDLSAPLQDTFSVGVAPYDHYSIRSFAREVKALHDTKDEPI